MSVLGLLRRIVRIFFRIYFRIDFVGAENIPAAGAMVLVSNHPSYLDPITLQMGTDRWIRWLGMKEITGWPIVGMLSRWFGMLEVGDSPRGGGHALWQAMKVLEEGGAVGLYPEGGRTEGTLMGPAKAGLGRLALQPGVTIVPAVVFGMNRAWPRPLLFPAPRKVVIAYLPPMRFTGEPSRERFQQIADEVRDKIVAMQRKHRIGPALRGSRKSEARRY